MLRRLTPLLGLALIIGVSAPAQAVIRPDVHCAKGRVALTFDDGPSKVITPRLLRVLRKHHAQVTFFVQGHNVKRYPRIVRAAVRDGHAVEDHSWDHPDLTRRNSHSVRRQLDMTKRAIQRATGRTPELFRPPYGATSARIRRMAAHQHLHQQLWTIDTRDWSGISAKQIRSAALRGLRPHRSNVILMHDAVGNSARTLKAVPGIIHDVRKKGYCLVPLQKMMPLGEVSSPDVATDRSTEEATVVPLTLRLDGPSQRRGTVRLTSVNGSAVAGEDFDAVNRVVTFQRGMRSVTVLVRVHGDPLPGPPRVFAVHLSDPHGLRLKTTSLAITIAPTRPWSPENAFSLLTAGPSFTLLP